MLPYFLNATKIALMIDIKRFRTHWEKHLLVVGAKQKKNKNNVDKIISVPLRINIFEQIYLFHRIGYVSKI